MFEMAASLSSVLGGPARPSWISVSNKIRYLARRQKSRRAAFGRACPIVEKVVIDQKLLRIAAGELKEVGEIIEELPIGELRCASAKSMS